MKNIEKLRRVGLRPTKQRLIIADILFNGPNRHFSAEDLQDEITSSGNYMSLGTVYNCLKKFKKCGLIKQVEYSKETAVFDTNTNHHHHFLDEETGQLIDFESDKLVLQSLPQIPKGFTNNGLEIIIKLKKNN